ncbi:MAG: DNA-binding protein [Desulfovibrio sp.]|jgi:hypothetical protein|nr:DNA-binding protein [Desulfovibrio sp.]
MTGPFFNTAEAARYCGYRSGRAFLAVLRGYDVPRLGPKKNRFSRVTLDEFMSNPDAFRPCVVRRMSKKIRRLEFVSL